MTNEETIAYFKKRNEILVSVAKDENVYDYEKQVIEADCMREAFEANEKAIQALEQQRWIPVSERLPEYGVAVLTYDGSCYYVEKRIPTIRGEDGEPLLGGWWVSDDYDESNSEYYPNLRDDACIAWLPLPQPYKEEQE